MEPRIVKTSRTNRLELVKFGHQLHVVLSTQSEALAFETSFFGQSGPKMASRIRISSVGSEGATARWM